MRVTSICWQRKVKRFPSRMPRSARTIAPIDAQAWVWLWRWLFVSPRKAPSRQTDEDRIYIAPF